MQLIKYVIIIIITVTAVCKADCQFNDEKSDTGSAEIYLVNYSWHTGIIIRIADIDTSVWPESNDFGKFSYIDVGWGDEKFYRTPGFDPALAAKALFYPTPSALRIQGIDFPIENYLRYTDNAEIIKVTQEELKTLCGYIHETYFTSNSGEPVILEKLSEGRIIFYKARGKYDAFNTCNTWIAKGLYAAGFKELDWNLSTVAELFKRTKEYGIMIKSER